MGRSGATSATCAQHGYGTVIVHFRAFSCFYAFSHFCALSHFPVLHHALLHFVALCRASDRAFVICHETWTDEDLARLSLY